MKPNKASTSIVSTLTFLLSIAATLTPAPVRAQVIAASDRAARLSDIGAALDDSVASFERKIARPNPEPTTRDLTNCALSILVRGGAPKQVESMLRMAFDNQNMDPASANYGKIPWQIGHPEVNDDNSISFDTQAVGPILLLYGDKLDPDFKAYLRPHIIAAFTAIRHHTVSVKYTNIYLMNLTSMILMGQAVDDTQAISDGNAMLDQWLALTKTSGLCEYDSPTYTAVDLSSLVLGYRCVADLATKVKYRRALELVWTDIAANYFNGHLSGPHSRDYNFLTSAATVDLYYYAEGLRSTFDAHDAGVGNAGPLICGLSDDGYHPGADVIALAHEPERIVTSRFGDGPIDTRYNDITPDFSIGSVSVDGDAQVKPIDIELASAKDIPAITVVPDNQDSPYGILKKADKSGHRKVNHLPLHPMTAQDKGALLALLDIDGRSRNAVSSLAVNVILPRDVDAITVDGKPVAIDGPFETPVNLNSVVGIRRGHAMVAIRVFEATPAGNDPAAIVLKGDDTGLRHGAIRIAIYLYRGAPSTLSTRHAPVGLLFLARHVDTNADAAATVTDLAHAVVTTGGDSGAESVDAKIGDTDLAVECDLDKKRTLSRTVNGSAMASSVLTVNGVDLASRILGPTL